jgi:transcriptional regulator with XRE-family HTH domain
MENFGEKLRRLRASRSQKEVAGELGLPVTTLSSLENQASVPRGEMLHKLTEYYKIPVSYFYKSTIAQVKASDAAKAWVQEELPASTETKATDAALAWVQQLREPAQGKDVVATQSNIQLDEKVRERIAELIRRRHAKISTDK